MKRTSFIILCVFVVSSATCAYVNIDYSQISVIEEGGCKFTKLTSEDEITIDPKNLPTIYGECFEVDRYSPFNMFCVTPDDKEICFIGYKEGKYNIYLKSLVSGKAITQRTFSYYVSDLSITNDGKKIAFSDYRNGNYNIYMINKESGSIVQQITNSQSADLHPEFSKEDSSIFYVQKESREMVKGGYVYGESKWFVWSCDLTKNLITQYPEGRFIKFFPDNKNILVARLNGETNFYELWKFNLKNGTESIILSSKEKSYTDFDISPDGNKILFVSNSERNDVNQNLDIYLINSDGTGMSQITFHPGNDINPRWSRDGKSIYFISQRGSKSGEYNIWKLDLK